MYVQSSPIFVNLRQIHLCLLYMEDFWVLDQKIIIVQSHSHWTLSKKK